MKLKIGLYFLGIYVNAFTRSEWPPFGDVPPIRKEWTRKALKGRNTLSRADFSNDNDFEDCGDSQAWALTYDDGPGKFTEERVLKPLAERNWTATFFVVGQEAAKSPDALRKIHDAGHQIGIHTWSHPELTKLSNDQIVAEIVWTAKIIKNITGVTPTTFRPPFGDIDARVRGIVKNLGLSIILWNRDTKDFEASTNPVSSFTKWVREPMKGTISLQHDLFLRSSKYVEKTIAILGKSSYQTKKISECSGIEPYNDKWLHTVTTPDSDTTPKSISTATTTGTSINGQGTTETSQSNSTATSRASGINSWIVRLGIITFVVLN